jgi:chaperonin cofactor prefoldin
MGFVDCMTTENDSESTQETERGSDNLRERVRTLVEKTSGLNESLDRVRENLREASGHASSSGQDD